MSEALNQQTRRARRETHTADMKVGQAADLVLPNDGAIEDHGNVIQAIDTPLHSDETQALMFMEEPVEIRLEKSAEKNAETHVQVAVNGKGAEVFENGKWIAIGWLPINQVLITRRKYVEVLARAKPDAVNTVVHDAEGDPRNAINRTTSSKYPFSVLSDKNPKGHAWLSRILMEG